MSSLPNTDHNDFSLRRFPAWKTRWRRPYVSFLTRTRSFNTLPVQTLQRPNAPAAPVADGQRPHSSRLWEASCSGRLSLMTNANYRGTRNAEWQIVRVAASSPRFCGKNWRSVSRRWRGSVDIVICVETAGAVTPLGASGSQPVVLMRLWRIAPAGLAIVAHNFVVAKESKKQWFCLTFLLNCWSKHITATIGWH